jgi:hypothetical protein
VTDRGRDRPDKSIRNPDDLSAEEVEARLGIPAAAATKVRRTAVTAATEPVAYATTRRRVLWRDSATILIGVVVALLVVRFLLPSGPATAEASPSPEDTGLVAIASSTLAPTPTDTTLVTFGNVVPPSLHLDATPTPIPVITLPPPTPRPQPTPTLKPGQTPGPTATPGPKATPKPTPTPPPVVVSFHCDQSGLALTCHDLSLYETQPSKRLWTFVQSGYPTVTSRANPAAHTFAAPGDVTVTLTVYGYNGSTSHDNFTYTLTAP